MDLKRFNDRKMSNLKIDSFLKQIAKELEKMEQKLVIDRFEGDIAICEDRNHKEMVKLNKAQLPKGAKEGTVLKYEKGSYQIDMIEQKEIEDRIQKKMNKLWK